MEKLTNIEMAEYSAGDFGSAFCDGFTLGAIAVGVIAVAAGCSGGIGGVVAGSVIKLGCFAYSKLGWNSSILAI